MTAQISAFPLRMPQELRAWFELAAADNGRSLNSEIVQQLKEIRARAFAAHNQEGVTRE
jgi:predicted HicB family RNase H-like nuclease